jgi:hypothetical protein
MLKGNHYRAHDSIPSPEYLRDMRARLGLGAGEAPADPFLAKADALLAKIASAMDPKAAPVEEDLRDPLAKANAAVAALAKAIGDGSDFERRLTAVENAQ